MTVTVTMTVTIPLAVDTVMKMTMTVPNLSFHVPEDPPSVPRLFVTQITFRSPDYSAAASTFSFAEIHP